jgi:hypothetical protein
MTYDDWPGRQSWPSGQQHGRNGQRGQEPGDDGGWQPPEWRYAQPDDQGLDPGRQYQPQQGPWNAASGARYSPSFSPSQPPHMPPRQPSQRGKSWPARHKALTGCLAFVALIIIIVAANSGRSPSSPGSGTTAGLTTTASATAATAPSPHVTQAAAAVQKSHPKKTTQATSATSQAPAPSAPAQTPPAAVAAPPVSAAPASCHPLTNGGNCYKSGEYCRDSDHSVSGVAGNGEAITCENSGGWRWEPS